MNNSNEMTTQQIISEDREDRDFFSSLSDTPVILLLPAPMQGTEQYYGPFENGIIAKEWISRQPSYLRFTIIPLRNPDRARPDSNDWYFVQGESDFDKPE